MLTGWERRLRTGEKDGGVVETLVVGVLHQVLVVIRGRIWHMLELIRECLVLIFGVVLLLLPEISLSSLQFLIRLLILMIETPERLLIIMRVLVMMSFFMWRQLLFGFRIKTESLMFGEQSIVIMIYLPLLFLILYFVFLFILLLFLTL